MTKPKGLIQYINERCYELYKNGMSAEEIAIEMDIPELLVVKGIAKEKSEGA